MLRWPDYLADPPSDTTSGDVNRLNGACVPTTAPALVSSSNVLSARYASRLPPCTVLVTWRGAFVTGSRPAYALIRQTPSFRSSIEPEP